MKNKIEIDDEVEIEPYQPFFFSGLAISILGLGVWILFQMGWMRAYPQEAHGFLMIMGFLFAYISGFLMTAVPKMAQAKPAQGTEVKAGVGLLWLQVPVLFLGNIHLNYAIGCLQILVLFFFVGSRFMTRKANPPKAFVFLPFGLIGAALGCFLLAFPFGTFPSEVIQLSKLLLYQGLALNLILGLGSRLVPALTRVQGALDVRAAVVEKSLHFLWMALILNLSFFIEVFFSAPGGQFLKFLMVAWVAIQKFKILKPRQVLGALGFGIRLSVYCLAMGFLLAALFPVHMIHFLHFSYIGGFALLTILISTRVVLAHGGYNLGIELKSHHLLGVFSLAIGIGILRVVLGFQSQYRSEILWILFLSWAGLCCLWSFSFLLKLLKIERSTNS